MQGDQWEVTVSIQERYDLDQDHLHLGSAGGGEEKWLDSESISMVEPKESVK